MAGRLGRASGLLADPARLLPRHRTLDAALEWSFELLDDAERVVLARLSTFAAPFSLAGAEAVAVDGDNAAETVSSLVDKSLIVHTDGTFRLLETTRQFAAARLEAIGGRRSAETAHGPYVADRARTIHTGLSGPDEARWVQVLDRLWPDVRAAVRAGFDRADADTVTTIIVYLAYEIFYRRPEAFDWVTEAVDRWGDTDSPHRHELLAAGGYIAFARQQVTRAVELAELALQVDPAPGQAIDCLPEIVALGAWFFTGDFERGQPIIERLVAGADLRAAATTAAVASLNQSILGDKEAAVALAATAEELAKATGNPSTIAYALMCGANALARTDRVAAETLRHRSLAAAASVRNQWILGMLGTLQAVAGDTESLRACVDAAVVLQQAGWTTHAWHTAWSLPGLLYTLGRPNDAALVLGACHASGVARAGQWLPPTLEQSASGDTNAQVDEPRNLGAKLNLTQVFRLIDERDPPTGTSS